MFEMLFWKYWGICRVVLKARKSSLEVLRCLFLQLRISLEKQNLVWKLALKVYVGGKKLYNVEIESIVEESHLEKVA